MGCALCGIRGSFCKVRSDRSCPVGGGEFSAPGTFVVGQKRDAKVFETGEAVPEVPKAWPLTWSIGINSCIYKCSVSFYIYIQ